MRFQVISSTTRKWLTRSWKNEADQVDNLCLSGINMAMSDFARSQSISSIFACILSNNSFFSNFSSGCKCFVCLIRSLRWTKFIGMPPCIYQITSYQSRPLILFFQFRQRAACILPAKRSMGKLIDGRSVICLIFRAEMLGRKVWSALYSRVARLGLSPSWAYIR